MESVLTQLKFYTGPIYEFLSGYVTHNYKVSVEWQDQSRTTGKC